MVVRVSAGGEFYHGVSALRWSSERRLDGIPDEPSSISSHPLPADHLRAGYVGGKGLPRAEQRGRDNERLFRTVASDGKV